MNFRKLFNQDFPIIGCVHLLPLPDAPSYAGSIDRIYDKAVSEAILLSEQGVHGLIVENFGDTPFYADKVSSLTVAMMASIVREIIHKVSIPVGVNVLRNDAHAAIAIATATQAQFIRVNVHMHAMMTDQGILQGKSYDTLRLRSQLKSAVQIWSDINVKHAHPMVAPDLVQWTHDLTDRGLVDCIIVSGTGTGKTTSLDEVKIVKENTHLPVIIGSGMTPDNKDRFMQVADGAIVGSYFKRDGVANNELDLVRIERFMRKG